MSFKNFATEVTDMPYFNKKPETSLKEKYISE
jgi:hypothetical protein